MKNIKRFVQLIWNSVTNMIEHDGIEHAGYLAFLLMLTIFPFLVFITAILGFFGSEQLGNLLVKLIIDSSWASFIDALKPRIIEITSSPPQSLLTIAILSAVWTASSIFEALRTILNRAYRVTKTPGYLLRRLISILEFLIAITVIIFFMLILVILPYASEYIIKLFAIEESLLLSLLNATNQNMRFMVLFILTCLLIATLYNRLPNRSAKFIWALPGAILVMLCWTLASVTFKYYLGHFPQVNFIYGSIAGVIISLLYFYICSIIFIIGAEFNYQFEETFINKIGQQ